MFSRPSFRRMADVKALFIQHLKQEGITVRDDEGFLQAVFSSYQPKLSYSTELSEVIYNLNRLPAFGEKYWINVCLGDIYYVFFRNMAVLYLASNGVYKFEYAHLVQALVEKYDLDQPCCAALLKLREIKHAYRTRQRVRQIVPCLKLVQEVIAIVGDSTKSKGSVGSVCTTNDYFLLRIEELELVSKYDPRELDKMPPYDPRYAAWHLIRNSGGYPKPRVC